MRLGYDYTISYSRNTCPTCHRSESGDLFDGYLSYNHSWIFSKYLESDIGLRILYDLPLPEVVNKLNKILKGIRKDYPTTYKDNWKTQDNYNEYDYYNTDRLGLTTTIDGREVKYDGWAKTAGNAYLHCRELLLKCQQLILDGYDDAYITGD